MTEKIIQLEAPRLKQLQLPLRWHNDVWMWGNPLATPPRSFEDFFRPHTNYRILATVIRLNFWKSREGWLQILKQAKITEDDIRLIVDYELEAKRQNIKNVQDYIAVRIGKDQSTVSRLLQLIDLQEAAEVLSSFAYIESSVGFISSEGISMWNPSRKQIDRKIKGLRVECAGYGLIGCQRWTPDGSKPLCWHCHSEYSVKQKGVLPEWLKALIATRKSEVYDEAVNLLHEDHYGMVSIEEYESLVDAA